MEGSSQLEVQESTLTACSSEEDGGAIRAISSSKVVLSDVEFLGNDAVSGGCISMVDSVIDVTASLFEGCIADADGGALHVTASTVKFDSVTMRGNAAGDRGGAICALEGSDLKFSHSSLNGNVAGDMSITADLPAEQQKGGPSREAFVPRSPETRD